MCFFLTKQLCGIFFFGRKIMWCLTCINRRSGVEDILQVHDPEFELLIYMY